MALKGKRTGKETSALRPYHFIEYARREFEWMKISHRTPAEVVVEGLGLRLLPVSEGTVSGDLVAEFGQWRAAHQYAYPTRFEVTAEGTESWLRKAVLANADRLLFLITDSASSRLGHIGLVLREDLDCTVELDNVLRGRPGVKGAMSSATLALENWAYEQLGALRVVLRVLASNSKAVAFYEKIGYEEWERTPLTRRDEGDGRVSLVAAASDEQVSDEFITMGKHLDDQPTAGEMVLTAGPSIGHRETTYTSDAVRYGWNANHSDYLARFEREFADYVGVEFALATSSCTGALHLALLALGVGPGDEVLVPDVTWVATASAVEYVGATPVFVDIDARTWTLDPQQAEEAVTPRTRAMIPVHLYGVPADMTALQAVARRHDLAIIEDAAPAIGALHKGSPVGGIGEFGAFSFQGAKMLVTGEGGMLVTNDADLYATARQIWDHGRTPGTFWIEQLGVKYKMPNATAALGLAQLERSEQQIDAKTRIARYYRDLLADVDGLRFQEPMDSDRSIHWMTSVTLPVEDTEQRAVVTDRMRQNGVDTRPVFPQISSFTIWSGDDGGPGRRQTAQQVAARSVNLPSGVRLRRPDLERVATALRASLGSPG
ncbi:MAG: bifunctional GNAT family N-acetyltransferase/PLP-dependent aspartate aminotransferase family protein [Acidimicrobiia bacterium]